MEHNAIYNLYPNVKTIDETDGVFYPKDENGNLVSIDMSAVNSKATELQTEYNNKIEQDKADKVSGNQKLLDLGLTQAEATALTGYTPPVAE